ncbi:MSMEG_1061 family FMN-dependent PPOX-type flavoprotein [Gordonia aquimaris]|uniref:Pyridoxamine 5'-phosphate oxidase family protein n=1 Tax=Gordonia aquimaris TaxID=2984863 RepID=A0A9X3DA69_9ACTN|nr:MSMEG_1061 family FMN-dependent PPOX-type flavoprotein [Gordonia aquimaris]MCX2966556.1 pyridoxamine 5'-phosphate oxidase family protein [Gordonia aquimaris]
MQITTEQQLRDIVGQPHQKVIDKVRAALHPVHVEWLAACPMVFLATSDASGRMDVSPKGDPAGKVVHILDQGRVAIPERPGNRRVDGYLNVLQNPHVGLVALIPGRGDTLRINGTARIVDDGDYFDALAVQGVRPLLALEVDVEEVFFHCAKAFLRSNLWRPDTWEPDALPSTAKITKALMPDLDEDELEKAYAEPEFRKWLY